MHTRNGRARYWDFEAQMPFSVNRIMKLLSSQRVAASNSLETSYSNLLEQLAEQYKNIEPYALARDYYTEIMPRIRLHFDRGSQPEQPGQCCGKDLLPWKKKRSDRIAG